MFGWKTRVLVNTSRQPLKLGSAASWRMSRSAQLRRFTDTQVDSDKRKAFLDRWRRLLDLEWAAEQDTYKERMAKWPQHRLQAEGFCLMDLEATQVDCSRARKVMDRDTYSTDNGVSHLVMRFNRREKNGTHPPFLRHSQFEEGCSVCISSAKQKATCQDAVLEGQILQATRTVLMIAITDGERFADLNKPYRLDLIASKTSYLRTVQGLLDFTGENPKSPYLQKLLIDSPTMNSNAIRKVSEAVFIDNVPRGKGAFDSEGNQITIDQSPVDARAEALATDHVENTIVEIAVGKVWDEHQLNAVARCIGKPLSIVQGPPGTGKTATASVVLQAAHAILKQKGSSFLSGYTTESSTSKYGTEAGPMLACADSNVAVDQLATALLERGLRPVRFGSAKPDAPAAVQAVTLGALMKTHPLQEKIKKAREAIEVKHAALRDLNKSDTMYRRIRFEIRELHSKIDKAEDLIMELIFKECDVVCATLVGSGTKILNKFCPRVSLVLIDECAQATEPRSLIAIANASDAVVLVGDEHQLPPTCNSQKAERNGLGISLFERVVKQRLGPATLLTLQHRMHPLIRTFPSKVFYGGFLVDGPSAESRVPPAGMEKAVLFLDVNNGKESKGWNSFRNEAEVAQTVQIVHRLMTESGIAGQDIGVISPYAAQVKALKAALGSYDGVAVRSVDGFQGNEKDVILVSCVRANTRNQIGFLNDYRRLNVAITRAKRGLIVIGNRKTLKSSTLWAKFFQFVDEHDLQGLRSHWAAPTCGHTTPIQHRARKTSPRSSGCVVHNKKSKQRALRRAILQELHEMMDSYTR